MGRGTGPHFSEPILTMARRALVLSISRCHFRMPVCYCWRHSPYYVFLRAAAASRGRDHAVESRLWDSDFYDFPAGSYSQAARVGCQTQPIYTDSQASFTKIFSCILTLATESAAIFRSITLYQPRLKVPPRVTLIRTEECMLITDGNLCRHRLNE